MQAARNICANRKLKSQPPTFQANIRQSRHTCLLMSDSNRSWAEFPLRTDNEVMIEIICSMPSHVNIHKFISMFIRNLLNIAALPDLILDSHVWDVSRLLLLHWSWMDTKMRDTNWWAWFLRTVTSG